MDCCRWHGHLGSNVPSAWRMLPTGRSVARPILFPGAPTPSTGLACWMPWCTTRIAQTAGGPFTLMAFTSLMAGTRTPPFKMARFGTCLTSRRGCGKARRQRAVLLKLDERTRRRNTCRRGCCLSYSSYAWVGLSSWWSRCEPSHRRHQGGGGGGRWCCREPPGDGARGHDARGAAATAGGPGVYVGGRSLPASRGRGIRGRRRRR